MKELLRDLGLNVRIFFQGAYLSYLALFAWIRPPHYIATKVVGPVFYMIFFVLMGAYVAGRNDPSFYVIGNAMQTAALSGVFGVSMSIDGDRWGGTLIYLFGSPANRLALFLGRAFMHILDGVFGVIIALGWGLLIFGLDLSQTHLPALALTILITVFSTAGMGLMLGCLGLITRNVMLVNNTIFFLLFVFSGANVEIGSLPGWAQAVSSIIPLTRGIAAARLLIGGESLAAVGPLLWGEFLVGAAYAAIGFLMFRQFEIIAIRRGTLEAF
ncbi:MAG: ABC transporter permease [Chloroflexi bacterium]|nr:ABC transporter permease [Chloroflexota bacterium]